ncbi:hypothetical protein BC829DRAFT_265611 [Chytridium lagenaria]|nr:hypothetical protein BC829DRAFT_265611 [Chytridium lagenaria]
MNYAKGLALSTERPLEGSEALNNAMKLLPRLSKDPWKDYYDIMFGVSIAIMTINFEISPHLIKESDCNSLIRHAKTPGERTTVTYILCSSYVKLAQWSKVIEVSTKYLESVGIYIPSDDEGLKAMGQAEMRTLESLISGRTSEEILNEALIKKLDDVAQGKQLILSIIILASIRAMRVWLTTAIALKGCNNCLLEGFGSVGPEFFAAGPTCLLRYHRSA